MRHKKYRKFMASLLACSMLLSHADFTLLAEDETDFEMTLEESSPLEEAGMTEPVGEIDEVLQDDGLIEDEGLSDLFWNHDAYSLDVTWMDGFSFLQDDTLEVDTFQSFSEDSLFKDTLLSLAEEVYLSASGLDVGTEDIFTTAQYFIPHVYHQDMEYDASSFYYELTVSDVTIASALFSDAYTPVLFAMTDTGSVRLLDQDTIIPYTTDMDEFSSGSLLFSILTGEDSFLFALVDNEKLSLAMDLAKDQEADVNDYDQETVLVTSDMISQDTVAEEDIPVSSDDEVINDYLKELEEEGMEIASEEDSEKESEALSEDTDETELPLSSELESWSEDTETVLEEIEDITENQSELPSDKDPVSFHEEQLVGDVLVSVSAEPGVFPSGAKLAVSALDGQEQSKADQLIESTRAEGRTVASSYMFDIKILDEEGTELQPADGKEAVVSFYLHETGNENLEATVCHISADDKVDILSVQTVSLEEDLQETTETELDTEVIPLAEQLEGISVVTDGFSVYTVEFSYEDKTFVLEGDSYVRLDSVLNNISLAGEVSAWAVSNPDLFDVFLGGEDRLHFDSDIEVIGNESYEVNVRPENNGTVPYLFALQPFDTQEWLDVTLDGISYRITVTDDYIAHDGTKVVSESVVQGKTDDDFTETMPIATIFIDENVVFRDVASRNGCEATILYTSAEGTSPFLLKNVTYDPVLRVGYTGNDNVMLSFDTSVTPLFYGQDNRFDGPIYSAKFIDGAAIIDPYSGDRTNYDVVITYSNLHINVDSDSTGDKIALFGGNAVTLGHERGNQGDYRYGIKVDVNIKVVDKTTGLPIEGTYYYPMVDLDVYRGNQTSYEEIYGASDPGCANYSEQVILTGGLEEGKIWIPGSTGTRYKSDISGDAQSGLLISAGSDSSGDENTFYTGFATLVNNTNGGLDLTYRAASPGSTSAGIETYLLSGKNHINWMLKSTTGTGGNIQTTRYGNHDASLNDGSTVYGPATLTVATGQSVVYTMTPNPGYRIKYAKVSRSNLDTDGAEAVEIQPTPVDTNGDGIVDYYIFSFDEISSNGGIHVEWERTILAVHKRVSGSGAVSDTFTFKIKAWNPDNPSSTVDFTNSTNTALNQRFSAIPGEEGWYQFTLGSDETLNITSEVIPVEWKWEVQEVMVNDKYGTLDGWKNTSGTVKTDILPNEDVTQDAVFVNTRKKQIAPDRKIVVKKIWEDDDDVVRPSSLTMNIKSSKSKVSTASLNTAIRNLVSTRSDIQSILMADSEKFKNATDKILISSTGESAYIWRDGSTLYLYSDGEIFLNGNTANMFQGMTNLTDISGLGKLRTDYVTSMAYWFESCLSLTDLSPLASWETGNVTSMQAMFAYNSVNGSNYSSTHMKYSDISALTDWNTQKVTNFAQMFKGSELNDVSHISGWNVGSATNMNQMFMRSNLGATVTGANDLDGWDVKRVSSFTQMFGYVVGGLSNVSSGNESNFPQWQTTRAGSWGNNGTYTASSSALSGTSTTIVPLPAEPDYSSVTALSSSEYEADEDDDSIWIYEFEVDDASVPWSAYETVTPILSSLYETRGNLESLSPGEGKGIDTNPVTQVTKSDPAVIRNKLKTREVVLQVTWDDDGDSLGIRPSDMYGNIDYDLATPDVENTLSTTDGWTINGNVWRKTFKIPVNADIPDWGELLPAGYTMTSKSHTDGTNLYELVNAPITHDLTVKKNTPSDENGNFEFTVLFQYQSSPYDPISVPTGTDKVESGKYTFTLASNTEITFTGLHHGVAYTVSETVPDDWTQVSKSNDSGVMTADITAEFNNTVSASYGNLSVSKTVTGNMGDRFKSFSFNLKLGQDSVAGSLSYTKTDNEGRVSTGTVTSSNGIDFAFTLMHGETIEFEDLPVGITYTVTETSSDGYSVTSTNATGTITEGTTQCTFTNTKRMIIPTQNNIGNLIALGVFLTGAFIFLWLFLKRKAEKKN